MLTWKIRLFTGSGDKCFFSYEKTEYTEGKARRGICQEQAVKQTVKIIEYREFVRPKLNRSLTERYMNLLTGITRQGDFL
jgi:hypothetical protein